jgi:lipopolysaccharide transport system permease protein
MMNKTATPVTAEKWDMVIEPRGHLLDIRLKELWRYRDLLLLMVRRDFVSFYKQTIFGPIWFFVQPVFTTLIYLFVFNTLAGIKTDGAPAPLFYLAGITMWNYFSECLIKTSTVFRDNAGVFGKVYFPRLIMPLSIVLSNLLKLAVQLLLFFGALAFYHFFKGGGFSINAHALLLPLLLLQLALLGLGAGMIISALTTRYRDLAFLVSFGVQLLMYATTVVYPLSAAPAKYKWLIAANPLTPIIETFRYGFLGSGVFTWQPLLLSGMVTCLVALAGVLVFNKVEKDFIDTV